MLDAATRTRILRLAETWRCPLSGEGVEVLGDFFALLLAWGARINLTGAADMEAVVGEHLADSFALARLTPAGSRVVDVGSGGGLPAVPFSILRPDCQVTLVEPRAKRVAFLAAATRLRPALRTVAIVRGRDEVLPASRFDVAASRATFAPEEWLGRAGRLLVPGGRAVVFASGPQPAESGTWSLGDAMGYVTERGAARWAGAYVPRGTIARAGD